MTAVLVVWRDTLWQIFTYRPALMVMVLSLVVYGLLYPQPYLTETLRDIPVALVDQDGSVSSRELTRRLGATEAVQIAGIFPDLVAAAVALVDQDGSVSSRELTRRLGATEAVQIAGIFPDLVAAEQALFARRVHGVVYIPQGFERDMLRGGATTLALYADASYFLMYQRLSTGVNTVARGLGVEVEMGRLVAQGVAPTLALAEVDPLPLVLVPLFNPQGGYASYLLARGLGVEVEMGRLVAQGVAPTNALAEVDPLPLVLVPLFNPQGGYASYLLPAAFVLILQQTLMMGAGLLATRREPSAQRADVTGGNGWRNLLGQALAYVSLYAFLIPLFLQGVPGWYGLPALGSLGMLLWVALPFVLAAAFLGLLIAAWLERGELVQLVLLGIGLPFFFLSGFAWPSDAMPGWIVFLAQWVPSTPAIDALVRVTQMGATMTDVVWQVLQLWGLALFYGVLLVMIQSRRAPDHGVTGEAHPQGE